jgi:phosphoribosylglycinamide formyltransferase 1
MRLAFLASYNGSAARVIAQACMGGIVAATPVLLITNNADANALNWAKELQLNAAIINAKNSDDPDRAIADLLHDHDIDLALCSGYMKLIGPKTIAAMHGAILNIHPALLPKHGGKGMYGSHVHKAVHESGAAETGITIHLVDDAYDRGRILAQKKIPIPPGIDAMGIETMVKEAEAPFYVETLSRILSGDLSLGKVEQ